MEKYQMLNTDFWKSPDSEGMTLEDKYFYLYLLTNPKTNHIGIYQITKKEIAFELGYAIDTVHLLMDRFIDQYKLICYNHKTREIAIKNWGKEIQLEGGKQVMNRIFLELKNVEDLSLIPYVLESIHIQDVRSLYESFCEPDNNVFR
jgi:hypothetical protein